MTEIWRDIEGYPGYQVSNKGRVSSGPRPGYKRKKTIILKHCLNKGYPQVFLSCKGIERSHQVHRLVMEAFVGKRDDMFVLHLDNDPSNNCLDNLAWGTHEENMTQMKRDGRSYHHKQRQFTDEQVREIRASSLGYVSLSRIYGCGHTQIQRIKKRITYQDVE